MDISTTCSNPVSEFIKNGFKNLDSITDSLFEKMKYNPIVICGTIIGVGLAVAAIAGTGGAAVGVAAAAVGMFTKFPLFASLGYAGVGAALNTISGCILWAKTISVFASGELKKVLYDNRTTAQRKAICAAATLILLGSALTGAGILPAIGAISFLVGGKVTLTAGAAIAIKTLTLKAMATLGGAFIIGLTAKTIEQTRTAMSQSGQLVHPSTKTSCYRYMSDGIVGGGRAVAGLIAFGLATTSFLVNRCVLGGLAKCAATSVASAVTGLICLKYILKHAFTLTTYQDRNKEINIDVKKAKGDAITIFDTLHRPINHFLKKEREKRHKLLENHLGNTLTEHDKMKAHKNSFNRDHMNICGSL